MKEITLKMKWYELFGSEPQEIPYKERRERWEQWKALALKADKQGVEQVEYWTQLNESCSTCKWRDNDWCKESELPCNVNPILTIRSGIIGMACCGTGYEPIES